MKFIHGEFRVTLSGNVMLVDAFGPWNTQCVDEFILAYRQERANMSDSRWADIVFLKGESLLIPDAEQTLGQAISGAVKNGLSRVALVMGQSTVELTSTMQLENLYKTSGAEYRFFDTYEHAKAWVREDGFSTEINTESVHFA